MQQVFSVQGMNCQSCVRKIEQGMAQYAETVHVNLGEARMYLTAPRLTFEELKSRLAEIGAYELHVAAEKKAPSSALRPYIPLLLIVVYLAITSCAGALNIMGWMRHFMAGFFLVFSFFKFLNIRAFADNYAQYDSLAMRWKPYGYIYPFCELALGMAYLFDWQMRMTPLLTLLLTLFSAYGVLRSMQKKQTIRCACLGDLLNVPISTVTLIEDIGMAVMALGMLFEL